MDLDAFADWLERYFGAWASNDPVEVAALFAEDAVYSYGPFSGEARGREEIVRRWVQGGVQPGLATSFEPLAVRDGRGVAHWHVSFKDGAGRTEMDGILVCDFDEQARCTLHREWYHVR
ncbi:MAG TPA: nuclear transport factor 2 family protein, partial [Actinomycetota bacterium]|nr:nuclear transport factor 2 family protein [Actinomycetota bacterium]